MMIDFHNDYFKDLGFTTVLEGLEASINYPAVLYKNPKQMNENEFSNFYDTYILELKDNAEKIQGTYSTSYKLASLSTKIYDLDPEVGKRLGYD